MEHSRAAENIRKVVCDVKLYGSSLFLFHDCPLHSGLGDLLNFPTFKYKIRLSTHEQRSIWSAQHPLASSKAFHTIMDALVTTFIGIPTGNTKYSVPVDCMVQNDTNDHTSISARFEAHLRSRYRYFGVPTAFYGIYEAQGRGALHMHALI